jgi:hypothetical protein
MPSEPSIDPEFEIGHVLFIDIVGYSKLLIGEQSEVVQQLREIVAGSEQVRLAEEQGKLVSLPTGDGVALVFRDSAEAPARCALEIAQAVRSLPQLQLRMGIHSGPVNLVTDMNNRTNVAGAGINIAQRVMDCGDAGHILVSKHVAEDLEHYARWHPHLHDFGEYEVKHGLRLVLVNLYTQELGNPQIPARLTALKKDAPSPEKPIASILRRIPWRPVIPSVGIICALVAAIFIIPRFLTTREWHETKKARGPSYSKTSYENAKWSKLYDAERLFPDRAIFQKVTGWDRKNLAIVGTVGRSKLLLLLRNGEWQTKNLSRSSTADAIYGLRFLNEKQLVMLAGYDKGQADLALWESDTYRRLASVPAGTSLYVLAPNVFCGMDGRTVYWKYADNAAQHYEPKSRDNFILRDDNAVALVNETSLNPADGMLVANIRDVTPLGSGAAVGLWSNPAGSCAIVCYRNGRWYLVNRLAGFSQRNVPSKAWFVDEHNFVAIGSDKVVRCINGNVTFQSLVVDGQEYPAKQLGTVWGHDLNHYWTTDLLGNVFSFDGTQWKMIAHGPDLRDTKKFEAFWTAPKGSTIALSTGEVYVFE